MADESSTTAERERESDVLDALTAAPRQHTLLLENSAVRVLDTRIAPGERTPVHTHASPAALYVLDWSDFVRYDDAGRVLVDSRTMVTKPSAGAVLWSPPLTAHCAENVGDRALHVLAVEVKRELPKAAPLASWHELVRARSTAGLAALLADEVQFHSPVVHTPQHGKSVALKYLQAAFQVFANASFRYVREVAGERDAVLEFAVDIDGLHVNGVDMIRWNEDGKIVDFKVLLRPLKALQGIQQLMAAQLR